MNQLPTTEQLTELGDALYKAHEMLYPDIPPEQACFTTNCAAIRLMDDLFRAHVRPCTGTWHLRIEDDGEDPLHFTMDAGHEGENIIEERGANEFHVWLIYTKLTDDAAGVGLVHNNPVVLDFSSRHWKKMVDRCGYTWERPWEPPMVVQAPFIDCANDNGVLYVPAQKATTRLMELAESHQLEIHTIARLAKHLMKYPDIAPGPEVILV